MKPRLFSDIKDRLTGYIHHEVLEGVTSMIYVLVYKHYKASFAVGFLLGVIATGIFLKWAA